MGLTDGNRPVSGTITATERIGWVRGFSFTRFCSRFFIKGCPSDEMTTRQPSIAIYSLTEGPRPGAEIPQFSWRMHKDSRTKPDMGELVTTDSRLSYWLLVTGTAASHAESPSLGKIGFSLIAMPLFLISQRAVIVGAPVIRIEADRFVKIGDGFRNFAFFREGNPSVVISQHVIGASPNRFVIIGNRVIDIL